MRAAKRTTRAAGSLLLRAVLLVCVAFFLAVAVVPRTGAYQTLTVLTGSMEPIIDPGAMVVAVEKPASELKVGQIIVYQIPIDDHRVVTHRVVEILEPGSRPVIKTKGDANASDDPWVSRVTSPTVWVVKAAVPGVGRAISFLREPMPHRVTLFAVPILLAALWLVDIWGRPRSGGAPGHARQRVVGSSA